MLSKKNLELVFKQQSMNEQHRKELAYVKKVLHSCTTEKQKENAIRWAKDWVHRQKHKNINRHNLYYSIMNDEYINHSYPSVGN